VDELTQSDRWILEGALLKVIRRYIGRADLVIWLNPPKARAIFRIIKRVIMHRGKNREELANGCNESFDFQFLKWFWDYPRNKNQELIKVFLESNIKYVEIKSTRDLIGILEWIESYD
jgi:adenylate kinase family enzyme